MLHRPTSYFPVDSVRYLPALDATTEVPPALLCYGGDLPCIRYRVDHATGKLFISIELAVDERDGPAAVWVRVGYAETELRRQIKVAGDTWDAGRKLWRMSGYIARALKLQKRIVKDAQSWQ